MLLQKLEGKKSHGTLWLLWLCSIKNTEICGYKRHSSLSCQGLYDGVLNISVNQYTKRILCMQLYIPSIANTWTIMRHGGSHSILLDNTALLTSRLLARSQYPEGPATGHLDTGFSWFPCVYKRMLRWFPGFQVATTCLSCNPPDLNSQVSFFPIFVYM